MNVPDVMEESVVKCRSAVQLLPFFVATALLTTTMSARAQQDGDVTVIVKAKSKPAVLPTLLIMCDVVCNLKLDGEVKGHIDAGGAVKYKVEPGQHMVEASTMDGVDQVKRPSTVKPTGQTMISIEFQPIRDARLEADRQAQARAEQQAQEKASHEQQEKDRREREAQESELQAQYRAAKAEAERQPWTDPATGLMWMRKDNGNDLSWQGAIAYCRNLPLAGHNDWRLPTTDELQGIRTINEAALKGKLQLSGWAWSGLEFTRKKGKPTGYAWAFDPNPYEATGLHTATVDGRGYPGKRALCVRGPAHP